MIPTKLGGWPMYVRDLRLSAFSFLLGIVFLGISGMSVASAAPYDETLKTLRALHAQYPAMTELFELGKNDQGVAIEGIRISRDLNLADAIPQLVVGSHHGNEIHSVEVALSFAQQLLARLSSETFDPLLPLHKRTFYVVPTLNISGFNARDRYERDSAGRRHDPNRDYSDPCRLNHQHNLRSTRALADFISEKNIISAVTVHGYIGTFTYPWGTFTSQTHTPDHSIFSNLLGQAIMANGYRHGTHADVIYPTTGAFEDWAYHELGVWVALLEIKQGASISKDGESLIRYFEFSPEERSNYHEHLGECRNLWLRGASHERPWWMEWGRP